FSFNCVRRIWWTFPLGSGCDSKLILFPDDFPVYVRSDLSGSVASSTKSSFSGSQVTRAVARCLPSLTLYRTPTRSFLISQIHSAVSDQEPLFELRIGSPTPRQPPISGLSSASASWAAARAAAASGLAFPFFGWSSAAATNARNDPNRPAARNFETGFMTATPQDGSKTF